MNRLRMRARASLKRIRGILLFLFAWFTAAALGFRYGGGLPWSDALLTTFYFEVQSTAYGQGYAFWGQTLVFGVLFAALVRETLENHIERCRTMAGLLKDHTIVVGYTHLGERIVQHCIEKGTPYALLEKNKELVDDLLRRGEPVIVDDARSRDALPAAGIKQARRLIVASNNIETALLVTKRARDANPALQIFVRCSFDEFTDVLEKLGADKVYSTSLVTFRRLEADLAA